MALPPTVRVKLSSEAAESISLTPVIVQEMPLHDLIDYLNDPEAADIVVTVAAYPMDYDLYQSQKALSAGVLALKKGGILILLSRCRHGIGDEAFFRLLSASPTPAAALETIHGGFVLGYHKAAHLARIAEWGEMWAVADIPDDQLQAAFIRPFSSVQTALDSGQAQILLGEMAEVAPEALQRVVGGIDRVLANHRSDKHGRSAAPSRR